MKNKHFFFTLLLLVAVLVAGCNPQARVGEIRSESHAVELGTAETVRVAIDIGAGDLKVTGGAEKLLEADFMYNVDALKPEVGYSDGTISVWQPDAKGVPNLENIADFRNKWEVRLHDEVPMDLNVDMGAGTGDLELDSLSLTGLNVNLGAGMYTIDLSGDWPRDLNATIETGAASLRVRLPSNVGTRVLIESGPHTVEAVNMTKDGDVYTNAAYGISKTTLQIVVEAGIGLIILEVEQAAVTPGVVLTLR